MPLIPDPVENSPISKKRGVTVAVIVPTLNAAKFWHSFEEGLQRQTLDFQEILVVDSSSTDGTADLARAAGYTVLSIPRNEFNHGGTRQLASGRIGEADIVVYLTQDVHLHSSDSIERLIKPFDDPAIGATYGRQIPRPGAHPIEAHARLFNYPEKSRVRTWEDRNTMGIRATFLSNSFSAYRRSALDAVGGFPMNTIMAEDAIVAGRLLMSGWKTAYAADALVVHSHPYTIREEFTRYFDVGVYHSRDSWILENFGSAGGEGKHFVLSELRYLGFRNAHLIPSALLRTMAKGLGYYLGRHEANLPPSLRRKLSLHKGFWDGTPS